MLNEMKDGGNTSKNSWRGEGLLRTEVMELIFLEELRAESIFKDGI